MATITLPKTYVNLVSTGALVAAYTGVGRVRTYALEGSVQKFAGGRFRSISTEGVSGNQEFMLRDVSDTDFATLQSWVGQLVLIRDNQGRRMFGTYYSVSWVDRTTKGLYDVQLNVSEVTYNEGS